MKSTINQDGLFTIRPSIGEIYSDSQGSSHEVAATWQGGVVFTGGFIEFASEFIHRYQLLTESPTQHELFSSERCECLA